MYYKKQQGAAGLVLLVAMALCIGAVQAGDEGALTTSSSANMSSLSGRNFGRPVVVGMPDMRYYQPKAPQLKFNKKTSLDTSGYSNSVISEMTEFLKANESTQGPIYVIACGRVCRDVNDVINVRQEIIDSGFAHEKLTTTQVDKLTPLASFLANYDQAGKMIVIYLYPDFGSDTYALKNNKRYYNFGVKSDYDYLKRGDDHTQSSANSSQIVVEKNELGVRVTRKQPILMPIDSFICNVRIFINGYPQEQYTQEIEDTILTNFEYIKKAIDNYFTDNNLSEGGDIDLDINTRLLRAGSEYDRRKALLIVATNKDQRSEYSDNQLALFITRYPVSWRETFQIMFSRFFGRNTRTFTFGGDRFTRLVPTNK